MIHYSSCYGNIKEQSDINHYVKKVSKARWDISHIGTSISKRQK